MNYFYNLLLQKKIKRRWRSNWPHAVHTLRGSLNI